MYVQILSVLGEGHSRTCSILGWSPQSIIWAQS